MPTYVSRHPGYYCRTTLHHRGWSIEDIRRYGGPDLHDDLYEGATYFRIERVLQYEEMKRQHDRIKDDLLELINRANDAIRIRAYSGA
jgi:hypothetical protein